MAQQIKEPCKKYACDIQACLSKNNFDSRNTLAYQPLCCLSSTQACLPPLAIHALDPPLDWCHGIGLEWVIPNILLHSNHQHPRCHCSSELADNTSHISNGLCQCSFEQTQATLSNSSQLSSAKGQLSQLHSLMVVKWHSFDA
ncbi:hypothetical protein TEA_003004 [Camellia sinensis var. sinensis]|uniref:Uncharacterized protein n=1 Tax=Camellia sinensis var. sinensis TaxID=542762 RepID=A0A4S4DQI1_CAMSN|nr:hypothetical protein TEA_003004 [Camellia sinensis var. sinensis]